MQPVLFSNIKNGDKFFFYHNGDPLTKKSTNQAVNKKGEIVVFKPKSRTVIYINKA